MSLLLSDVLEHRNNKYNFSHILPDPQDWPTFQTTVCCFGGPFNVRSIIFSIYYHYAVSCI